MTILPLAADQTIAQMWSSGARGGACMNCEQMWIRDVLWL